MIQEYYCIRLLCDFAEHEIEHGIELHGKDPADCHRQIRASGWKTYPAQRKAKCPECVKARG